MPDDSHCIRREPCPKCGSHDNVGVYSDGHRHCFTPGCDYHTKSDAQSNSGGSARSSNPFQTEAGRGSKEEAVTIYGAAVALQTRMISAETCAKYSYHVGTHKGRPAQFAHYFDPTSRELVACKVRTPDKKFFMLG